MMNKTRFLTLAVVGLIALNIGMIAFFLSKKMQPHRGDGPRKIIVERLHFDQKQVGEYEKLIQKHRADIRQKEAELVAARQAIYNQLLDEDYSKNDSLTAQVGRLQTAVEQIHFAHFRDIKSLCRPDQIKDFDALVGDLAAYFPRSKGRKKFDNQ
jgi:periplasmic protein CpxP/Spy